MEQIVILLQILMQFFATKITTKVLFHHPDYNDVLIFHFGIERASCARPQDSDVKKRNKGFSLYLLQSCFQNSLKPYETQKHSSDIEQYFFQQHKQRTKGEKTQQLEAH